MSRQNPYQKHNAQRCDDTCDGKQYMKMLGDANSWTYCKCVCHTSRSQ